MTAACRAVSGILTEYIAHPAQFDWRAAGLTWLATFLVAVASHFGLWKPTGVSTFVQAKVGRT